MPAVDLVSSTADALSALYLLKSSNEVLDKSAELADIIHGSGTTSTHTKYIVSSLIDECRNKKNGLNREAAIVALGTCIQKCGKGYETLFLPHVEQMLDLCADKIKSVSENASWSLKCLVNVMPAIGLVRALFPQVEEYLSCQMKKPPSKIVALKMLGSISSKAPLEFSHFLPRIIEVITAQMHDPNAKLSAVAIDTMKKVAAVVQNPDIHPHLGKLVDTMANPDHVPDVIKALSHVTFVAEVDAPALALMVPLLDRALKERSQETLRRSVIVTENLVRLVVNPNDAVVFFPTLMPGVTRVYDGASLPEVRGLARKALDTMQRAQEGAKPAETADNAAVLTAVSELSNCEDEDIVQYVADMISFLIFLHEFSLSVWQDVAIPYVDCTEALFTQFAPISRQISYGGEKPLVDLEFSLAYGGMMLLSHTSLKLMRGRRYAVLGRNGAGKSTLLRAIADGRVEGFPQDVKTWFVEHKLQGSEDTTTCLQYIDHPDAEGFLTKVGFDADRQSMQVSGLSGGWKMKLELARAMVENADILLLDEPTNHLDTTNVAWLTNYILTNTNMTLLVVSHDSGFLDDITTDVIHYEQKKLVYYPGNLSDFVKVKPEAKTYYTLAATNVSFEFPQPGILTGIKSNTKAIMKMENASFTYPNMTKKSLDNVSTGLSLSSRVAILGANGAGKSTLIKVLTGEIIPQQGRVSKHPNLRIGYVAQHAFSHIEMHLEKTPNQYIQWRYANGEDREVMMKASRIFTDDEKKVMEQEINGRKVESLIGRQKFKKSFRYEVKWLNMLPKHNTFMTREELLSLGFQKLVQQFDDWESSREGLSARELSPKAIRKHFEDIGLDGDIADHNEIKGLSGGQKVKVVIAAAMWQNVHVLILDEPTNFLDRDSLGGLAVAIKNWGGAVCMISHNEEFVSALCPEQWHVADGKLERKGKIAVDEDAFDIENVRVRKKKVTKKQQKEKDTRARLREIEWLNSPKGTPKPKSFYSDDES